MKEKELTCAADALAGLSGAAWPWRRMSSYGPRGKVELFDRCAFFGARGRTPNTLVLAAPWWPTTGNPPCHRLCLGACPQADIALLTNGLGDGCVDHHRRAPQGLWLKRVTVTNASSATATKCSHPPLSQ